MTTKTFPVSSSPQLALAECAGKLTVEAWDEPGVAVEPEAAADALSQAGESLAIRGLGGDLHLRVPAGSSVVVADHRGDITARGIERLTIERAEGDVRVEACDGAIRLRDIYGRAWIDGAESLLIEPDTQPCREHLWRQARREIMVYNTRMVEIAEASDNLTVARAQQVAIGAVGGNAHVHEVAGDLRLGNVGGSGRIEQIAGVAQLAEIGGNAGLHEIGQVTRIGDVGGSLRLEAAQLSIDGPERAMRLSVGGNARLELSDSANLTIHAIVGGTIRVDGASSARASNIAAIRYGDGSAQLNLTVGGGLELHGGAPQTVGAPWSSSARASKASHRPGSRTDTNAGA